MLYMAADQHSHMFVLVALVFVEILVFAEVASFKPRPRPSLSLAMAVLLCAANPRVCCCLKQGLTCSPGSLAFGM